MIPGATAPKLAGVCTRSPMASRCGSRAYHGWSGPWPARTTRVPGQQDGLVCRARRPPDAEHQDPVRARPPRHRPEVGRDARVSSPRWQPTSVAHGMGTPLHHETVAPSGPAWRLLGRGSRGRDLTHTCLVPQSAHPHLWRLSVSASHTPPLNPVECGNLRQSRVPSCNRRSDRKRPPDGSRYGRARPPAAEARLDRSTGISAGGNATGFDLRVEDFVGGSVSGPDRSLEVAIPEGRCLGAGLVDRPHQLADLVAVTE